MSDGAADRTGKGKAGVEVDSAQLPWVLGLGDLLEGVELDRAGGGGRCCGSHCDNSEDEGGVESGVMSGDEGPEEGGGRDRSGTEDKRVVDGQKKFTAIWRSGLIGLTIPRLLRVRVKMERPLTPARAVSARHTGTPFYLSTHQPFSSALFPQTCESASLCDQHVVVVRRVPQKVPPPFRASSPPQPPPRRDRPGMKRLNHSSAL